MTFPYYPKGTVKQPWNKPLCMGWIIVLIILYAIPVGYDLMPDVDSYLGGYSMLGIWGVLILTGAGMILSILYGYWCVSPDVVYACASAPGFRCEDHGLIFPDNFPDDLKTIYINQLNGKSKGLFNFPWSEYHRTLSALNKHYLYA